MKGRLLTTSWTRTVGCALAAACAVAVGASAARAVAASGCPSPTETPYRLHLRALTGPAGADLALAVDTAVAGCAIPSQLKKVQLKTYAADGSLVRTWNLTDVEAPGGSASLDLGQLPRNRRVEADVLVQTAAPERTYVVRGNTTTLLRPDLVVEPVDAPRQTLMTRPVDAHVTIVERNGDVGAAATVTMAAIPDRPISKEVTVGAGGRTTVDFTDLVLTTAAPTTLTFTVGEADPGETDAKNNTRTVTIDVTRNELDTQRLVVPSLGGYGAQFNQHLYAPVTPKPATGVEAKMVALEPQLVRIFYNDNWDANADGKHPEWQQNYASFVKVCLLAQESGATINVTFHTYVNAVKDPAGSMAKFAQVLDDLVRVYGCTSVRWTTIGNEPNGGTMVLDIYNTLYRELNAQLVARGLRDHIGLMGGDLVEASGLKDHHVWLQWIADNMGDILDAYSEHVYWWYDRTGRMEFRLRDTARLVSQELPEAERKPTYLMEFGVRGLNTCGTKPVFANLYYGDANCSEIWRTNIAAFQQLWFNIESAQLGFAGTAKWDAYWARYDNSSAGNQLYWMVGPQSEELTPTYNAMWLLFHTTSPGWKVVGVDPWVEDDWSFPARDTTGDQPEQEITAYSGPDGELTLIGLDTHGQALNTASTDPPSAYSIGGLPPNAQLNLELWNATGDGTNTDGGIVETNDAGVARFEVPVQAAFALTTLPAS
jgi:hypothetical protein